MTTNFPSALDTYTTQVDYPDAAATMVAAALVNNLQDAVGAIESLLGVNGRSILGASGIAGSSFPAQPAYGNNRPFFRTDLGWWCFYDGTRWLTAEELGISSPVQYGSSAAYLCPIRTDFAPYITRIKLLTQVDTTNNSSHYWTVYLQMQNSALGGTVTVGSFKTQSDTAGAWTKHEGAPSSTPTPSSYDIIYYNPTATGSPGTLHAYLAVYYRLIVT